MHSLIIELVSITENAAIAAYPWLGRGDKNRADGAAVNTMRNMLNKNNIDGKVVIGEGEMDDAPMLYIGEKLGTGRGPAIDIAVDPIDGTRMTAMGQNNAITVIAVAEQGGLLGAPDMYMEKLVVNSACKGIIDLNLPIMENLSNIAKKLNKPLEKLRIATLNKPRHHDIIRKMRQAGIQVFAIPDGDIGIAITTCIPEYEIDAMYCIGGAPEGVISAVAVKALQGDFQGKLIIRTELTENSRENQLAAEKEITNCHKMGVNPGEILCLDKLVSTNNICFSATGITRGDLLSGIKWYNNVITTETLSICGQTRTIRKIISEHHAITRDNIPMIN